MSQNGQTLGKNDQKVYVVPSDDLVVVRLGNDAGEGLLALSDFDGLLWEKISALACTTSAEEPFVTEQIKLAPNPTSGIVQLQTERALESVHLVAPGGQRWPLPAQHQLNLTSFPAGLYWLEVRVQGAQPIIKKIVLQ